jgi:hypothetical protein
MNKLILAIYFSLGLLFFGPKLMAQDRDSVSTEKKSYELAASPNPFENEVTITITSGNKRPVAIRIFDLLGTEVAYIDLKSKTGVYSYKLDFSSLPAGVYFCNVYGDGGIIEMRRLSHRK